MTATGTLENPPAASRPTPATASRSGPRPLRSRYAIAVLLVLVALIAALGWNGSVWSVGDQKYLNMQQTSLPGTVTLQGGGPTYYLYAEGISTVTNVRVTNTAGQVFSVTMRTRQVDNFGGWSPKQVAVFDVRNGPRPPLPLRVEITGNGYARVGSYDATQVLGLERWGIAALLVVNFGAAIGMILVPIVRRRRHQSA